MLGAVNGWNIVAPSFKNHIQRYIRGLIAGAHSWDLVQRDNDLTHQEAAKRRNRKTQTRTITGKGDRLIEARDIRRSATLREQNAVTKAEKALQRAIRADEIVIEKANTAIKSRMKVINKEVYKWMNANKGYFITRIAL